MKILANDGLAQSGIDALTKNGFEVSTENIPQEELIQGINDGNYVGLLVRSATKVRKDIIDNCPNLKFIGRGGVGMDNIDVEYARSKGITVNNTPGASSQSVAELVMGHLFSISRSLHDSFKNMETGEFKKLKKQYGKGVELRGKTIAIIGFGKIGQSLASYALGCGMNVVAMNRTGKPIAIPVQLGNDVSTEVTITPKTSLEEILPQADFISLHIPAQGGNAIIGEKEFNQMKNGVRIVNAARGGVVDEDALLQALESGKVATIGLDVYENEPNPRKDLLNHPKIACTPHIGAATVEAQDRIGTEMAENIVKALGTC